MIFRKPVLLLLLATLYSQAFAQQKKGGAASLNQWSKQSNIYEVNLRQYSSSGSFKDFARHLPRLRKMGVEILWFMPITPIGIEGRKMTSADLGSYYAVRNYKAVNEEFGSMGDFKALVKTAHKMGFKVITDWVANHSSRDNNWVKDHPDFYVKDSAGNFVSPFDWTDVYKLNYNNRALKDSMIAAMQFWLRTTNIDGFRCDVAEEVPAGFWKECITALRKTKNIFMLAEGNKPWLHEAGFNETYTWDIMTAMTELYAGKINLQKFDSTLTSSIAQNPKDALRLYFTTNHDENSWNGTEYEKYGDAYQTFAVFCQTIYQSVPLIYSGQEEPNKKRLKFFVKDNIEWKHYALGNFYKTLLTLRRSNPALAADAPYKRIKSTDDNSIFAYSRQMDKRKLLVILNFSGENKSITLNDKTIVGIATDIFTKKKIAIAQKCHFTLAPWGYKVLDY